MYTWVKVRMGLRGGAIAVLATTSGLLIQSGNIILISAAILTGIAIVAILLANALDLEQEVEPINLPVALKRIPPATRLTVLYLLGLLLGILF